MDVKTKMKLVGFLNKFVSNRSKHIYTNCFVAQITDFSNYPKDVHLPKKECYKLGISTSYLNEFYDKFNSLDSTNPHGIMVIKDGYVIMDVSYRPYHNHFMHATHSLCKSITTLAILLAVQEKLLSLDDLVIDYFKNDVLFIHAMKQKNLTIRHLLMMSSGVDYSELNCYFDKNWVKGYFEAPSKFKPGTEFSYNSLNSYILSVIITKVSHVTLEEYLTPRLFEPLGIYGHFYEKCPKGYNKGGWGVYLSLESMAKIGLLYLQKGSYHNQQIIESSLIEEAITCQIDTTKDLHLYGYGYQVWMNETKGCYNLNGMLGQNVIVIPHRQMVVAMTAGSTSFFSNSAEIKLINEYFVKGLFLKPKLFDPIYYMRFQRKMKNAKFSKFKEGISIDHIEKYFKQNIKLETNNISIMPLFLQGITNNYTLGIDSIYLDYIDNMLIVKIVESNHEYCFQLCSSSDNYHTISFQEEVYLVGVTYELTYDEDDHYVLKLQIDYVETSNSRIIKIVFDKQKCVVKFDEIPRLMDLLEGKGNVTVIPNKLKNELLQFHYFQYKLDTWICPSVNGRIEKKESF